MVTIAINKFYTGSVSKIGVCQGGALNLNQAPLAPKASGSPKTHRFWGEPSQPNLNKLGDAGGFKFSGCPTPAEPIFESRAVYHTVRSYTIDSSFGKCIAGRFIACSALEFLGSTLGAYLGGPVLGTAIYHLRVLAPVAQVALFLSDVQKKTTLVAAAAFGVSVAAAGLPWSACMWLGSQAGFILGGYAGLMLSESSISFWDHTINCDSYLVGMTKFIVAGEIFDRVITRAEIPYFHLPLNAFRSICASLVKTFAYHSNSVLHIFKSLIREKKFNQEVIIPHFVKMTCSKFCKQNAVPVTTRMIKILSEGLNVFPSATKFIRTFLSHPIFLNQFQSVIESLSENSDRLTMILMRSFLGYVDLVQNSKGCKDAKTLADLKMALKKEIWGAAMLSWAVSPLCKASFESNAETFLNGLDEAEKDLLSISFLQEVEKIKPYLAAHLKYFIFYAVTHPNFNLLSTEEEEVFFHKLSDLFFSIHKTGIAPNALQKMTHCLISAFFFFKAHVCHFIEQPDETAIAFSALKLEEQFYTETPESETIIEPEVKMIEGYKI